MTMDITWLMTAISLSGNTLNVKKKRAGFVVWMVANVMWLLYDISIGLYSRAALDIVQTAFCIWGIIEWKDNKEEKKHG